MLTASLQNKQTLDETSTILLDLPENHKGIDRWLLVALVVTLMVLLHNQVCCHPTVHCVACDLSCSTGLDRAFDDIISPVCVDDKRLTLYKLAQPVSPHPHRRYS